MVPDERTILLPNSVISPTDIARLTREIEIIDSFFREQSIRSPGESTAMPHLSKLMDQLSTNNQVNLLNEADRTRTLDLLEKLHTSAPVMHISFSVDPPGAYVQRIVAWLRSNIDEHVLVTVGLQPNIGAGCIVRTTNKIFDFSLREYFAQKREFFVDRMHQALTEDDGLEDTPSVLVAPAQDEKTTIDIKADIGVAAGVAVAEAPVEAVEVES